MKYETVLLFCLFCFINNNLNAQTDSIQASVVDTLERDSVWKSLQLKEVTVKGTNVKHYSNRDVWTITNEMRKNTITTYELLEKIPSLYYDRVSQSITYKGEDKVLLIVDGKEKDAGYIGNLANIRFNKIEIYENSHTRFPDYNIVINLKTKDNWRGYDFVNDASALALPSSKYGDLFSKASESVMYTYTQSEFDLSTGFSYNHNNSSTVQEWNILQANLYRYMLMQDCIPNASFYSNAYRIWIDYDYKLSKNHTLSAKYTFNTKSNHSYGTFHFQRENMSERITNSLYRNTRNDNNFYEHTITFYYRGKTKTWELYSDLGADFYNDHTNYSLNESTGFSSMSLFHNKRKVWNMNIDATKTFNNQNALNFALSSTYRYYYGKDINSGNIETNDYRDTRFAINYRYTLSQNLSGFLIGAYNYAHVSANEKSYDQHIVAGAALIKYVGNDKKTNGYIRFYSMTRPPSYSQILPFTKQIDSIMTTSGNPLLKTEVVYATDIKVSWRPFYTSFEIQYSGNKKSIEYTWDNYKINSMYQNIKSTTWKYIIGVEPIKIKLKEGSFQVKAEISRIGHHAWHNERSTTHSYWNIISDVTYTHDKIAAFQLQYSSRPQYVIYTQGEEKRLNDWWRFSVWKYLMKKRLFIEIDYRLPIKFGVGKNSYERVSTPFYDNYNATNFFEERKNSINLTIRYKLFRGHQINKKQNNQSNTSIQDEF